MGEETGGNFFCKYFLDKDTSGLIILSDWVAETLVGNLFLWEEFQVSGSSPRDWVPKLYEKL